MWTVRRGLTYVLFAALATLAAPAAAQVADGFAEVASDIGVKLYRKDYEGGQPDFVLVVNLENARFESKAGPIASLAEGTGVFGGNNATIARSSLTGFWDSLSASLGALFAAVNAGFFSTGADPTRSPSLRRAARPSPTVTARPASTRDRFATSTCGTARTRPGSTASRAAT